MPGEPGRWDLGEITRWVRARDRRQRPEARRKNDPGEKLKRYRAALAREKWLREKGLSMPVADHERYTTRLCVLFRSSLLDLAASLGSQLEGAPPAARDEVIQERCRELLEGLIEGGDKSAAEER